MTQTRIKPGDRDDEQAALRKCTVRVAGHVAAAFDDRGAFAEPTLSRVLESALMLALLRRRDLHARVQTQLEQFIGSCRHNPHLHPMEQVIAQAALGLTQPPHALHSALDDLPAHTRARKHTLLSLYLAVLGQGPYPRTAIDLDYRGQTTWGELNGCALKILAAHGHGHQPNPEDGRFLTERLATSRREVWEGNVAAYTLALLALDTTGPASRLITDGIDALLHVRNPDGGLPFIPDHTHFITAVAGLALARCALPEHHNLLARIGDYLAAHQNADGGWAYTERVTQCDTESTSAVLEALHAIDPTRHARALNSGRAHLAALAGADGGFPTYLPSEPGEAVMTANAVLALAPDPHHAALVHNAALFLLDAQHTDGTFERSWSLTHTHGLRRTTAALSIVRHAAEPVLGERIDEALHRAGGYLQHAQNTDGGFGHQAGNASDVTSTAHALAAAAALGRPSWTETALAYLLAHQQADGNFASRPEQVAPRPLPYHHPSHPAIFTLTALGELHHSLTPRQRRPQE